MSNLKEKNRVQLPNRDGTGVPTTRVPESARAWPVLRLILGLRAAGEPPNEGPTLPSTPWSGHTDELLVIAF